MKLALRLLLALVLGFVGGWAVSASAVFRYMDAARVVDRDGGGAMGAFFIVGPFFGVIAAIVLAGIVLVSALAQGRARPAGWKPSPRGHILRTWVMAAAALVGIYLVGWALIDLSGPWAPRSLARSLWYNGIPLAAGLLGVALVLRRRVQSARS